MPKLTESFFSVIQTAIQNCNWAYKEFDNVKAAEGQLEALRQFTLSGSEVEDTPIAQKQPVPEVVAPIVNKVSSQTAQTIVEAPMVPEAKDKLLTPTEAAKVPDRPMPQEILDAVADGIELAKNPPKVANVVVQELSKDPIEAAKQFAA